MNVQIHWLLVVLTVSFYLFCICSYLSCVVLTLISLTFFFFSLINLARDLSFLMFSKNWFFSLFIYSMFVFNFLLSSSFCFLKMFFLISSPSSLPRYLRLDSWIIGCHSFIFFNISRFVFESVPIKSPLFAATLQFYGIWCFISIHL